MKEGTVPARTGFRRFNQVETEEIRRQVDKMLKAEVIAACYSPYAAGVVLHSRRTGPIGSRATCAA